MTPLHSGIPATAGWWLLALALMAGALPAAEQAAEPEPIRVMLLFPSDVLLPSARDQAGITQAAIRDAVSGDVEFSTEGLDALRLPGSEPEQEFVELLRRRYAAVPPDLVVVHGPMHEFVNRQRAALWPQARWMFAGVTERMVNLPDFPQDIPGTSVRFDVRGTLDLALRLQPDARHLYIVSGSSGYDRTQQQFVATFLDAYRDRLTIHTLQDESLRGLLRQLATVPPDSIVLQLSMTRDATGHIVVPIDVVAQIAAASSAPTYGYYDRMVGEGVVGGSVAYWAGQREMIGRIAAELLAGGSQGELLRMQPPVPSLCQVDSRQMERWKLSHHNLPAGCEVLFSEPGFWQRHYREAIIASIALAVQLGLMIALLMQRHRRQLAEIEAQHQRDILSHTSRLATIGELSASIAHEISQPLAAILSNAEAGESLLDSGRHDVHAVREILAAIRDDDLRANDVIERLRRLLRSEPPAMEPLDLNALVQATLPLVADLIRAGSVSVSTDLGTVQQVRGDRVQLQQVLINLLANAIDAMQDMEPARRRLSITTRELPGDSVEVRIQDSGPGIPAENLARVFEPLYSTKADGMGMGLSISRSIVTAHGGRIRAESQAIGAVFAVSFPVV